MLRNYTESLSGDGMGVQIGLHKYTTAPWLGACLQDRWKNWCKSPNLQISV